MTVAGKSQVSNDYDNHGVTKIFQLKLKGWLNT